MMLQSSPKLKSLLLPELSTYLLLDFTSTLSEQLYQNSPSPVLVSLFQDTQLHELSAQSPVLVPVSLEQELYQAFAQTPETWSGLLLQTSASQPELLASLRRALLVRFDGIRRAVLRYYDPRVASYFFPACTVEDLRTGFNAAQVIAWHGATWADESVQGKCWQAVHNPRQVSIHNQEGEPCLTEQQEQALSQLDCERFVWGWCQNSGQTGFAAASRYLEEGLSLGLEDSEILAEFLTLRTVHPTAELPSQSSLSGDELNRMKQIRSHMERALPSNMEKFA